MKTFAQIVEEVKKLTMLEKEKLRMVMYADTESGRERIYQNYIKSRDERKSRILKSSSDLGYLKTVL